MIANSCLLCGVDPVGVDSEAAWVDWTLGSLQVAATLSGVLEPRRLWGRWW